MLSYRRKGSSGHAARYVRFGPLAAHSYGGVGCVWAILRLATGSRFPRPAPRAYTSGAPTAGGAARHHDDAERFHGCDCRRRRARGGALRRAGRETALVRSSATTLKTASRARSRRRGIGVSIVQGEVTTLTPRLSGGYRLATTGHAALDADVVVPAVGNLPSNRFRGVEGRGFVLRGGSTGRASASSTPSSCSTSQERVA
jgi:hypothetical protein